MIFFFPGKEWKKSVNLTASVAVYPSYLILTRGSHKDTCSNYYERFYRRSVFHCGTPNGGTTSWCEGTRANVSGMSIKYISWKPTQSWEKGLIMQQCGCNGGCFQDTAAISLWNISNTLHRPLGKILCAELLIQELNPPFTCGTKQLGIICDLYFYGRILTWKVPIRTGQEIIYQINFITERIALNLHFFFQN